MMTIDSSQNALASDPGQGTGEETTRDPEQLRIGILKGLLEKHKGDSRFLKRILDDLKGTDTKPPRASAWTSANLRSFLTTHFPDEMVKIVRPRQKKDEPAKQPKVAPRSQLGHRRRKAPHQKRLQRPQHPRKSYLSLLRSHHSERILRTQNRGPIASPKNSTTWSRRRSNGTSEGLAGAWRVLSGSSCGSTSVRLRNSWSRSTSRNRLGNVRYKRGGNASAALPFLGGLPTWSNGLTSYSCESSTRVNGATD